MAQVHLVFYLELFETSRFSDNFQVPGWLGAAITAAGYPERSTDSGLGFGGSGAATARRRHGAVRAEGRSAAPPRILWRYSISVTNPRRILGFVDRAPHPDSASWRCGARSGVLV